VAFIGSSALRKAVVDVLDHPIIVRANCTEQERSGHKPPLHLRRPIGKKMRATYHPCSRTPGARGQGRVAYRAASQMKMLRKSAPPRKTRASLS